MKTYHGLLIATRRESGKNERPTRNISGDMRLRREPLSFTKHFRRKSATSIVGRVSETLLGHQLEQQDAEQKDQLEPGKKRTE